MGWKELTTQIVNRVNDFNYDHKIFGMKVLWMWVAFCLSRKIAIRLLANTEM